MNILKVNNIRYHENHEKAEILTQHYQKVSSDDSLSPTFRQHKLEQEPVIDQMLALNANDGEPLAYNANFTIKELKTALSKKKSTPPGGDTVHYDMLKQLNDKAKFQLLHLINKSWNEGELPTQWKESTIIPLLKPNKDPHQPQSYRPISLTSAICKTMETMVATRLTAHLENNDCLAHTQSGFRKHRSTIDQITRLESAIRCAKLEKRVLVAVFLDLEKAFDLMWRKGTLQKLTEFGLKGKMLKWIQDFLTCRKIRVRVGTDQSDFKDSENGSPQGSVLSPILFNVIINTLEETLKNCVELTQFADDGAFRKTAKNPKAAISAAQKALNILKPWADTWNFKISTAKTSAVIFNRCFKKKHIFFQN